MEYEVRTICKQSISVCIIQALLSSQLLQSTIPIAVVVGPPDLPQVRSLVQRSRGLVLSVAPRLEVWQLVKVQRARDHDVLAGQRVRQDRVGRLAVAQLVGAVLLRDARRGAAALVGDLAKNARDGAARRLRRRLEVLDHLGRGPVERGLGGGRRDAVAVLERLELRLARRARAVRADVGALLLQAPPDVLLEVAADLGRGGAVDVVRDGPAVVGDGAVDVGGAEVCGEEGSPDDKVEIAARAEIVDLGRVPFDVDCLSSLERLEGILADVGALDCESEAVERNLGCFWFWTSDQRGIMKGCGCRYSHPA